VCLFISVHKLIKLREQHLMSGVSFRVIRDSAVILLIFSERENGFVILKKNYG
jgi:hypothetical protein